jgi:predicted rRNA methylase YqxC with S4 and FtsJ domains
MFNPEFFPTPLSVLEQMGIDCYDKVCLEPSAGKGDIIDYLNSNGAAEVLACEFNKDLATITATKGQLIANDFFTVTTEQVSHINLIVMNPPFSNADKHILHAWNISPEGCEIIALCNYQTIENSRGYGRNELKSLISDYGESQNLGDCFSHAERKTGVEVGLIRLFKPVLSEEFNWDGFFYSTQEESQSNGIMSYNEVRAIVNTYVAAVKCFDKAYEIGQELSRLTGEQAFNITVGQEKNIHSKEQFAREFQIKQWKRVFNKLNLEKFVTNGVMKDINKFTNSRLNYPFTMKNIYRMIDIILGTREATMNRAICEAIDNFTRHTHENRFGVEGWKTNEGHLLNRKFIASNIAEDCKWSGFKMHFQSHSMDYLDDLNKAICYLTGTDFASIPHLRNIDEKPVPNHWYDWGFFDVKVYKKGTGHFKFKDEKVWEILNRAYGKIKGQVLPDKFKAA